MFCFVANGNLILSLGVNGIIVFILNGRLKKIHREESREGKFNSLQQLCQTESVLFCKSVRIEVCVKHLKIDSTYSLFKHINHFVLVKKMDIFSKRLKFYTSNPRLYKFEKKGFNLDFYQKLKSEYYDNLNIKTIIDIGANEGQSTITFTLAFPNAYIYAFEPLPEAFERLKLNFQGYSNVRITNIALGEKSGKISFEQNEYSASSSALIMSENHIMDFPHTKGRKLIEVNVETLDSVFKENNSLGNILMKIDVQGYEKFVILGGKEVLSRTKIVIVETSFEVLYNDQALFNEIYMMMSNLGFRYMGSFDQLISPKNGKILQQDAIFIRNTDIN